MFKVSVIVPMYNVEKYLKECIESIIQQTIGFRDNIQLILIDDNSSDNSYSIASQFAEKYSNNIVLKKLEENSGSGGKPRNVGIECATGKYLMFSDADDFFALDAFEVMYNAIEEKNADFIVSNWNYADSKGTPWEQPVFDAERFQDFKLSVTDYTDSFYVMNSSMCNKIFRKSFIEKYDIRCLEDVPGEDTYFSMKAFLNTENVWYIKNIIYFYRQRNMSHKTASISWNCSRKFFKGMNYAYKKTYDLFVEKNQLQFYRFLYARNMTYLLYRFIDSSRLTNEERLEIIAELRWFFKLSKTLKVSACQKSLTTLINFIIEGRFHTAIDVCKIIAEMRTYMTPEVRHSMSKPVDAMYKEILKTKI